MSEMNPTDQPPESPKNPSRRDFIRAGAAAVGAAAAGQAAAQSSIVKNIFPASVIGANERILTGHIGLGGMGKRDLTFALLEPELQPIAMCDLIEDFRNQGADITENNYKRPTTHEHFEDLIENKDIDAIVIVTPDHWHTIPGIMACEAGKDVWCEKPLTTTMLEGQPIIDAVRNNKRVFQCGNFQRSGKHFQEAVQMVRDGYIGKVARVETWIHDSETSDKLGNPPDSDPPPGIDWNRYLGWTPRVPFNPNRFVYNFRWFLDYSGGKMTDWGAHLIDIVLWAMGEDNPPREVMGFANKYVLTDNRTTPDTCEVLYRFDNYILSFSNRVYNGATVQNRYGIKFHGDKGTLYIDRTRYDVIPVNDGCQAKTVEGVLEGDMNRAHWKNWVECIKSRKDPISFVESAFNTAKVCHMGTASYVAGGRLGWDDKARKFIGDDAPAVKKANDFTYRPYQNGYSLKKPYMPTA
jgi:predicted dehydrogenase